MDVAQFHSEERFQWLFDEYEITPGSKARRVRLKAPLIRTRVLSEMSPEKASLGVASGFRRDPFRPDRIAGPSWSYDPRGTRGRPPGGGRPPGPPNVGNYLPTLYIQIAWDATTSDPVFRTLESRRDQQLHELETENARAITQLRERLLWIGTATCAIVVLGGWVLIGLGLSPLKRLSHAVSQVSAKDFKLPLDANELPVEVSPVAERLQDTLQQLQAAFAREKRASADISHELRSAIGRADDDARSRFAQDPYR